MACLEIHKQRYGNALDFYNCYESLNGSKNKFLAFWTKCEVDSLGKRPIGKKKARQAKADAKLVKAIISEVIVKKEQKVNGDSVLSAYKSSGECSGVNNKTAAGAGAMTGDALQNISSDCTSRNGTFGEHEGQTRHEVGAIP